MKLLLQKLALLLKRKQKNLIAIICVFLCARASVLNVTNPLSLFACHSAYTPPSLMLALSLPLSDDTYFVCVCVRLSDL